MSRTVEINVLKGGYIVSGGYKSRAVTGGSERNDTMITAQIFPEDRIEEMLVDVLERLVDDVKFVLAVRKALGVVEP